MTSMITQRPPAGPQTRTIQVDPGTNRLNGPRLSYDAAGNLTSFPPYVYSWDAFNMMSTLEGGGNDLLYAYTADDERLCTLDVASPLNLFTYRLRGLDGKVRREFSLSHKRPKGEPPWQWEKDWIYRDGLLLASASPGPGGETENHYHLDHLGSPRFVTDQTKGVVGSYPYFPFGEPLATANVPGEEEMRFTGHERDFNISPGLGDDLDYMHARYYNSMMGRMLSVDPIGGISETPQSWNRYAYVLGNPLKYTDPFGLKQECTFVPGDGDDDGDGQVVCSETIDVTDTAIDIGESSPDVTPWQLGYEWLSGSGPRTRGFSDGDRMTGMLREHSFVQNLVRSACEGSVEPEGVDEYDLSGISGIPKYLRDYSTLSTGGLTGNLAVTYLGSYDLEYKLGNGAVGVFVTNSSTAASGFRPPVVGYTPWWNNTVGAALNNAFSSGPMSETTQNFAFSSPCP